MTKADFANHSSTLGSKSASVPPAAQQETCGPQGYRKDSTEGLQRLSDQFLRANNETYEWLVQRALAAEKSTDTDQEVTLRLVTTAAIFGSTFHPGRFADGALENVAYRIGASLQDLRPNRGASVTRALTTRRRVLHVTPLITLGGHSPLIDHWIRADTKSSHSVVLVNQQGEVPARWLDRISTSGGHVFALAPGRLLDKAAELRVIAEREADLVVWHVIDPDVVPIVAFAVPNCPPVAIVNHCDHQLWLGSSVADELVNLRSPGSSETAERRFIPRNLVLPIPLEDRRDVPSREEARRKLQIDQQQPMILSVGRAIKFRPCSSYDFVATVGALLDRLPTAQVYVVGESLDGIRPYLRSPVHPRLHFVGPLEGQILSTYRAAADIYIESFPYGSQTALLEAALSGLPVVLAYAPLAPTLVAHVDAIRDVVNNPPHEQAYIERAISLIQDDSQRRCDGAELRIRVLGSHVGPGWLSHLSALYSHTDSLVHAPRAIPTTRCAYTPSDIGLSYWSAVADARGSASSSSDSSRAAGYRHASYIAKHAGNYSRARGFAIRGLLGNPLDSTFLRLLASAVTPRVRARIQTMAQRLKGHRAASREAAARQN